MKYLRSVIIGIGGFAMIISFSGLVCAEMGQGEGKNWESGKENYDAQTLVLRDSAAALQTSNPNLAKGLSDLTGNKASGMLKGQDLEGQHAARVKLLQDSAMALQTSNPSLSKELQKMSEKKQYMERNDQVEGWHGQGVDATASSTKN